MSVFVLPCEILHREFDSKLLLALRLVNQGHICLIGFDKYFNAFLQKYAQVVLYEKSLSTIMFESRIARVKNAGGRVVVSDEEGSVDLEETPEALAVRVDKRSIKGIDSFHLWGNDDYQFYSHRFPDLVDKMTIIGSHRFDLLNSLGRDFYSTKIAAIKEIFGNFALFNDNIGVDHFDSNYQHPRSFFSVDDQQLDSASKEYKILSSQRIEKRNLVAEYLVSFVKRGFPLIIRPHPVYDSIFWHNIFRKYRNATVIYRENVEPWIHASSFTITAGCTTGLQAALAHKPSFNIPSKYDHPFNSKVLPPLDITKSIPRQISNCKADMSAINLRMFHECESSTEKISQLLHAEAQFLNKPDLSLLVNCLNTVKNPFAPSAPKWSDLPLNAVKTKVHLWSKALSTLSPKVQQVQAGVFLISPS